MTLYNDVITAVAWYANITRDLKKKISSVIQLKSRVYIQFNTYENQYCDISVSVGM